MTASAPACSPPCPKALPSRRFSNPIEQDHVVEFFTAAAPPPEAVLAAMKAAGFNVTHLYGLTETYGPATVNEWQMGWDALPAAEQSAKKARQGVRYVPLEALDVRNPDSMCGVP